MTRALAVMLATLMSVTPSLAPRAWGQVEPGSLVRVTTVASVHTPRVGRLVALDPDTLRYVASDTSSVTALPLASVTRLERSAGRRSNSGRGAVIGGVIGGGLGLILGLAASAEEGGFYEVGPEQVAVVTVFMGGVGAGIGALIGTASKREKWEPVPLPTTLTRVRAE